MEYISISFHNFKQTLFRSNSLSLHNTPDKSYYYSLSSTVKYRLVQSKPLISYLIQRISTYHNLNIGKPRECIQSGLELGVLVFVLWYVFFSSILPDPFTFLHFPAF